MEILLAHSWAFPRDMLAKDRLRRFCHPDDIAAAAMFLCAERPRHIQASPSTVARHPSFISTAD
jgi:hypothetical protein